MKMVRSGVHNHVIWAVSLALAVGVVVGGCSAVAPAATGTSGHTFLADERPNASAWYAERIWLLVLTQNGSDVRGSLTNLGPVIDPGASPQESTRLLEAKRD